MKNKVMSFSFLSILGFLFSANLYAAWIDWSDIYTGTLDVGGSAVDVTMSGMHRNILNGDYYYNNAATGYTSETGTYAGLEPSDVVRVSSYGSITINFSEEIVNPYMALISVGRPNYAVTYNFQDSFSVISSGGNIWWNVPGGHTEDGTQFSGSEFNGILQFAGTFSSISFEIANPENWHGFNFGVGDVIDDIEDGDDDVIPVPEPSALLLLAVGMVGVGFGKKRLSFS